MNEKLLKRLEALEAIQVAAAQSGSGANSGNATLRDGFIVNNSEVDAENQGTAWGLNSVLPKKVNGKRNMTAATSNSALPQVPLPTSTLQMAVLA